MSPTRISGKPTEGLLLTLLTGDDPEILKVFEERWQTSVEDISLSEFEILRAAKSCRFECRDNKPRFHITLYVFNMEHLQIEIAEMFEVLPPEGQLDEHARSFIARATALGVPVIPHDDRSEATLLAHHKAILRDGFKMPDETGKSIRVQLARHPGTRLHSVEQLRDLKFNQYLTPADLLVARDTLLRELSRHERASGVLASLELAILELTEALESRSRNEHDLQSRIAAHPILFGPDYVRIIPKHRLGAEYEMDYALERHSGLYDLVEIESSNLSLFTKAGNPTRHLVHAEQQVMDWLAWLAQHASYAAEKLPGISRPRGFVIIGRRESLSERDQQMVRMRNGLFREDIQVLTYDDLLDRARHLLTVLSHSPS